MESHKGFRESENGWKSRVRKDKKWPPKICEAFAADAGIGGSRWMELTPTTGGRGR